MPKAMRQRLTPHQLSKMSGRAKRGLASKVWMGGVRPESKINPEYVSYVAKAMMRHPEPGQTQVRFERMRQCTNHPLLTPASCLGSFMASLLRL